MSVNAPVSGGRWRCVCCESFVTYQELEVCGLTREALQMFADDVSSIRDRVEFRADGSFRLLNEPPLRHKNRNRRMQAANGGAQNGALQQADGVPSAAHDTIEIIDLDD